MTAFIEKRCSCGKKYMAREADIKRGWAKSCSKSCAAKKRDNSKFYTLNDFDLDPSWDSHKSMLEIYE